MQLSLFALFTAIAVGINAAVIENRDVNVTVNSGSQVLTATKVYPTLVDFEPYMLSATSEVVWTQYSVATETASTSA
ncbi:hypothetical protein K435DRAFT_964390 [Dendrothele bispora CBS 962.96]|uniref:Uncharacterized protein n=1 Tax=Dendrothele bispora (strain CBS 962.96) TaxID=1314807 RepID=A0A4V4HGN6_DENBC|nr:hypothetical protein K435DRAFT_964390 [Dendrothele bispora CBS 962.96]